MYSNWNCLALLLTLLPLCSYASHGSHGSHGSHSSHSSHSSSASSLPSSIPAEGRKEIIVDPQIHKWGAYDEDGKLVKSGMATAGSNYCRDLHSPCRTKVGIFRIYSLGESGCKSHKFPMPRGGAPMPYCMYFNNGQALHGSNEVVAGNVSHGCVRLHTSDAKWIRFNFAEEPTLSNEGLGTVVIIKPYN